MVYQGLWELIQVPRYWDWMVNYFYDYLLEFFQGIMVYLLFLFCPTFIVYIIFLPPFAIPLTFYHMFFFVNMQVNTEFDLERERLIMFFAVETFRRKKLYVLAALAEKFAIESGYFLKDNDTPLPFTREHLRWDYHYSEINVKKWLRGGVEYLISLIPLIGFPLVYLIWSPTNGFLFTKCLIARCYKYNEKQQLELYYQNYFTFIFNGISFGIFNCLPFLAIITIPATIIGTYLWEAKTITSK